MKYKLSPWLCLLAGLQAHAAAPLDPAFLDYLENFADGQGEIFDPADLALLSRQPEPPPEPRSVKPEPKAHD